MKKILLLLIIFIFTGCSNKISEKSPNEILLSIKDYSCKIEISFFSNKNISNYIASQSYKSNGEYLMEFLDNENLKINYENQTLNITSKIPENSLELKNYTELNQNPLFLSYFINTYFNSEENNNAKISENSILITLPEHNDSLHSAKLTFKNNLPNTLTYFDKNGTQKVNIIYNEFTFI